MAASDLKVLGARLSPFVNRVQLALNLKSLDYEFVPEIKWPVKSELLLKSNPVHKKIPVLIHDGMPVCESLVIIQYIDETWKNGPSILPFDSYDRAVARFWGAYINDKWFPTLRSLTFTREESTREQLVEAIVEGMKILEDVFVKCSKGKGYFGGDDCGYVDIVLGCFVGWVKATEINSDVKILCETNTPALAKWAENFGSHKAVKGFVPETEEIVHLLKAMQAKAAASE